MKKHERILALFLAVMFAFTVTGAAFATEDQITGVMDSAQESQPPMQPETLLEAQSKNVPGLEGMRWVGGLTEEAPPTYDFGTKFFHTIGIPEGVYPSALLYNGSGESVKGVKVEKISGDTDCFQVVGPGSSGSTEPFIDPDSGSISNVHYVFIPTAMNIKQERQYVATFRISGSTAGSGRPLSAEITLKLRYDDSDNPNYKVVFNSMGGTPQNILSVSSGAGLGASSDFPLPTPIMAGSTFLGWHKDAACTTPWDMAKDTVEEKVTTLYAKWKPANGTKGFTVSFKSNGGSEILPFTGVAGGNPISAPLEPTKGDELFEGWYQDEALQQPWVFETEPITKDITLYAKWKETSGEFEYIKNVTSMSNGSLWIAWDTDQYVDGKKVVLQQSDCIITYQRDGLEPQPLEILDFVLVSTSGRISCTFKKIPRTDYAQVVTLTVTYRGQSEGKSCTLTIMPAAGSITPADGKCDIFVMDKAGNPIEDAQITLISSLGELLDPKIVLTTDENGEALAQLNPEMEYILLVDKVGYRKIEWPHRSIGKIWNVYMEKDKSAGNSTALCDFTVVDQEGKPVENAQVVFLCATDRTNGTGMTDATGKSRIYLGTNTYELTVKKSGFENFKAIYAVYSPQQALNIVLKPGEMLEKPDYETICTVFTSVKDPAGQPIPGAHVSLICPANNELGRSVTGSDGSTYPPVFIRSNNYVLTASCTGYQSYEKDVVVAGETTTFKVVLTPFGNVDDKDDGSVKPDRPGSGGGGGTGTGSSSGTAGGTTSGGGKLTADNLAKQTTEALKEQLATNGSSNPSVVVKNSEAVSADALKAMAETAKYANTPVKLYADTVNPDGQITARLYIDPAKAANVTGDIKLGVSTDATATQKTTDVFKQYFQNEIAVVKFEQRGSFGMPIDVAVKVDTSKFSPGTLHFYSYNVERNTYAPVQVNSYYFDVSGFLHFPTGVGNDIVITDKPLAPK